MLTMMLVCQCPDPNHTRSAEMVIRAPQIRLLTISGLDGKYFANYYSTTLQTCCTHIQMCCCRLERDVLPTTRRWPSWHRTVRFLVGPTYRHMVSNFAFIFWVQNQDQALFPYSTWYHYPRTLSKQLLNSFHGLWNSG
jgi:hypothetical protein